MRYFAIVGIAMLAAGSGCTNHDCNAIGVVQGLTFSIDSGPAPADYQLQVEHDGGLLQIDYSAMDDGRVQCVEGCTDLDDTLSIGPEWYDEGAFKTDWMHLTILGTPDWKALPSEVRVKIFRDAALAHDEVYTPIYRHSEPWGEDCGEAIQASYDVMLPR
ncbi:MAG: hypothetical protein HOV81_16585 [Kofleriaceae bacterium]|nr:hypothetical protein [Kofleriaceae bacterium]